MQARNYQKNGERMCVCSNYLHTNSKELFKYRNMLVQLVSLNRISFCNFQIQLLQKTNIKSISLYIVSLSSGYLLRLGLESHCRSTGHGSGSSIGPNKTGDRLPTDLQRNHRGADSAEGPRKKRGE